MPESQSSVRFWTEFKIYVKNEPQLSFSFVHELSEFDIADVIPNALSELHTFVKVNGARSKERKLFMSMLGVLHYARYVIRC